MFVIVSYDVATSEGNGQRRLRRVAKACQDFGQRVQYSVFECPLDDMRLAQAKAALQEVINHDEDQVLFIHLGPAEGRGDRVISALGLPYISVDAPCIVI